MSQFQQAKLWLVDTLHLGKDALHIYVALAVFFGTSANAHMQLATPLYARGRVMAIYMLLTLGSTVVGGPFVGWVCEASSVRVSLGIAAVATVITALWAYRYMGRWSSERQPLDAIVMTS